MAEPKALLNKSVKRQYSSTACLTDSDAAVVTEWSLHHAAADDEIVGLTLVEHADNFNEWPDISRRVGCRVGLFAAVLPYQTAACCCASAASTVILQ